MVARYNSDWISVQNDERVDDVPVYDCREIRIASCPRVTRLPRSIDSFCRLRTLSVVGCNIPEVRSDFPQGLEALVLRSDGIRVFAPPSGRVPSTLRFVDLSDNALTSTPYCLHGISVVIVTNRGNQRQQGLPCPAASERQPNGHTVETARASPSLSERIKKWFRKKFGSNRASGSKIDTHRSSYTRRPYDGYYGGSYIRCPTRRPYGSRSTSLGLFALGAAGLGGGFGGGFGGGGCGTSSCCSSGCGC